MVRCLLLNRDFTDPRHLREALLAVDWRAQVRSKRPAARLRVLTDDFVDDYVNELFSASGGAAKRRADASAEEAHSSQKKQALTSEARLAHSRLKRELEAQLTREAARQQTREEREGLEREIAVRHETAVRRLRTEAAHLETLARERWERQRQRLLAREEQLSQGRGDDDMQELATMFRRLYKLQASSHQEGRSGRT